MNFLAKLFAKQPGTAKPEAAPAQLSPAQLVQSMSVLPSPARIEWEHRAQAEILATLESRMVDSGWFLLERIPELMRKIRDHSAPFQGPNTAAALAGETFLSADEKRTLGLNPRMKYSHEFIACCNPAVFNRVEPSGALRAMHWDIYYRVDRNRQLAEFHEQGIDKVRISSIGTGQECEQVRTMTGVYKLSTAPALPRPGCSVSVCKCSYRPVVDGF